MGTLECKIPVTKDVAAQLPQQPAWVRDVAREVEAAMTKEAAQFGKALVGVPAMVDVVEPRHSALIVPDGPDDLVELVFRCATT